MLRMPTESKPKDRRCERKPARLALMLISDSVGEKVESQALSFDFTQFGVGVETSTALVPGQIVEISPREGPEYSVRGRVVWVGEAESDQGGKAGLEFLEPLPAPV